MPTISVKCWEDVQSMDTDTLVYSQIALAIDVGCRVWRLHILIAGQAFLSMHFYSSMASRALYCALQRHKWVNLSCHLSSFLSALWNSMGGNGCAKRWGRSARGFRLCVLEKEETVGGSQLWRILLLCLNHSICALLFHVSGRLTWAPEWRRKCSCAHFAKEAYCKHAVLLAMLMDPTVKLQQRMISASLINARL